MRREEAEEFTEALGQVVAGGWRLSLQAWHLGVPQALDLTHEEWVNERLGGYVRLSIPDRREAVAELTEEGMSTRQIGDVLGVDQSTVVRDANASREATGPIHSPDPGLVPDADASPRGDVPGVHRSTVADDRKGAGGDPPPGPTANGHNDGAAARQRLAHEAKHERQEREAATHNLVDVLTKSAFPADASRAADYAQHFDPQLARQLGAEVTPDRIRQAAAWLQLLADAFDNAMERMGM